jgi:hypothetical protein
MKREQDEGSVISSGSGDRPPEVLQIHDEYANRVSQKGVEEEGCVCTVVWLVKETDRLLTCTSSVVQGVTSL